MWFQERLHLVGIIGFVVFFIQVIIYITKIQVIFVSYVISMKIMLLFQMSGLLSSMVLFCAARRRAGFKTYKAEKLNSLL